MTNKYSDKAVDRIVKYLVENLTECSMCPVAGHCEILNLDDLTCEEEIHRVLIKWSKEE